MERQRSFSIKASKLLILCSTISSSLIFCFLFSFWLLSTTPSDSTVPHFQLTGGFNSSLFNSGNKNPIFLEPLFGFAGNLSLEALDSGIEGKDEVLLDAQAREASPSKEALNSVESEKDAILKQRDGARNGNASDLAEEREITAGLAHTILAPIDEKIGRKDNGFVSKEVKKEQIIHHSSIRSQSSYNVSGLLTPSIVKKSEAQRSGECDVSHGRWVFDESYPLYASNSCPYIDEGFSCEANGRMDKDYTKWRWLPIGCDIPRFNPGKMLELIKGKRLVFVGDSINRNQWESMLCLLRGAIPDPTRVYEARGRKITKHRGNYNFKFPDYDCSVEFYVSHYLVHESKARVAQRRVKTLRIDTVDRSSSRWRGADILVFNTAHWWSHHKTKSGVNYYQEGNQVHPHLDVSNAFRKALTTWASWIDRHVTPGKTQVFFRSSSPSHFSGGEWNSGGHCKESSRPLNDTPGRQVPEKNIILKQIVEQMRTPVTILNITSLSGLRIDGHPSIYGRDPRKGPQSSIQDCSHWCLPGVPDTWNELLYYHLLSKPKASLCKFNFLTSLGTTNCFH